MLHAAGRKLFSGRSRKSQHGHDECAAQNSVSVSKILSTPTSSAASRQSRLPGKRLPFGSGSRGSSIPGQRHGRHSRNSDTVSSCGGTPRKIGQPVAGSDALEFSPREINNQAHCTLPPDTPHRSVRKLSASFSSRGNLSSGPTTARSHVMASAASVDMSIERVDGTHGFASRERSLLSITGRSFMSSTSSNGNSPTTYSTSRVVQDENVPPYLGSKSKHILPKTTRSKTMGLLSSLAPSLSLRVARTSEEMLIHSSGQSGWLSRKSSSTIQPDSISSLPSRSPAVSVSEAHAVFEDASGNAPKPSACQDAYTQGWMRSQNWGSCFEGPPNSVRLVVDAMPSGYWAGRFQSLHDRFRSELLMPENLPILVAAQRGARQDGEGFRPPRSSVSTLRLSESSPMIGTNHASILRQLGNTVALPEARLESIGEAISKGSDGARQVSRPLPPLPQFKTAQGLVEAADRIYDDDNRCRRVFVHLKAMCRTREASTSLLAWQIRFARRSRREQLLPAGTTWSAAETWDWEHRNNQELYECGYKYERQEWDKLRRELKVTKMQPRPDGRRLSAWSNTSSPPSHQNAGVER